MRNLIIGIITLLFFSLSIRTASAEESFFALDFTATPSAHILIPDHTDFQVETNNKFTWSAWLYFYSTSNNNLPRIIEKGWHYSCIMGNQTNFRKNQFCSEVASGPSKLATEYWGTTRLVTGRWYHYTFVFDNGIGLHYINGQPEQMVILGQSYAYPLASTVGKALRIGNSAGLDRNFGGLISKVRFYQNRALTASKVRQLFLHDNVTQDRVGKWDMDEGEGITVLDSSGNNHNGSIQGAVWVEL